jgi:hypothetical protein
MGTPYRSPLLAEEREYTLTSTMVEVRQQRGICPAHAHFRRWWERLPVPPPAGGIGACPLYIQIADSRQGYTLASIQLTVERHTPLRLYWWH